MGAQSSRSWLWTSPKIATTSLSVAGGMSVSACGPFRILLISFEDVERDIRAHDAECVSGSRWVGPG